MGKKHGKSRRAWYVVAVAVCILVVLWVSLNKDDRRSSGERSVQTGASKVKEDPKWGSVNVRRDYVVPPLPNPPRDLDIIPVPPRPWEAGELQTRFNEALNLIRRMRVHPAVQTEDDRAIYEILDAAGTGGYQFHLKVLHGEIAKHVPVGYNCVEDRFGVGMYQVEAGLLASTLHHEMMHLVDCRREMQKRGFSSHEQMASVVRDLNRCDVEAPAEAAGIRMFLALWDNGLLPREVSIGDDLGNPIGTTHNRWELLLRGQDAFCRELQEAYRSHGDDLLLGDQ